MNYLLILVMALVGFVPMLAEMRRGSFDIFNLKNLFILYFVVQLGVSGLPTLISNQPSEIGLPPDRYEADYTLALALSTIGLLLFQFGYYTGPRRSLAVPRLFRREWVAGRHLSVALAYLTLGLASFFILVQNNGGIDEFLASREEFRGGGLSGQGFLLFPATSLASLGTLVFFLGHVRRHRGQRRVLPIVVLLVALIPAFFLGFRGALLQPVLQLIVVWHFGLRRLPMKWIAAVLVSIGVLFTLYGMSRELPPGVSFSAQSLVDVVAANPELAYGVVSRSKGTEVLAAVVHKLGETGDYEFGWRGLIEAFTIVVPKTLWADKPLPSGQRFTTYFFSSDLSFSRGADLDVWGGISPTVVGELYWNFGVGGVLVGLFLFGRLARLAFNTLRSHPGNPSIVILYAIFLTLFVLSAEAIQGNFNTLVMHVPVILFTWWLLTSGRARRGRRPVPLASGALAPPARTGNGMQSS